jgi:uncharacterized membrane protein YgdD (TMEM256/DUF423 family)
MGVNAMDRAFLAFGGVFAFLAVALGAFGAHALQDILDDRAQEIFETGVRYQMYHALALLLVGLLLTRGGGTGLVAAGWAFTAGILLFSGSLLVLSLAGIRWMGAVAPVGGTALLLGWALLVWSVLRTPSIAP